jgi:hypothetical protein
MLQIYDAQTKSGSLSSNLTFWGINMTSKRQCFFIFFFQFHDVAQEVMIQ